MNIDYNLNLECTNTQIYAENAPMTKISIYQLHIYPHIILKFLIKLQSKHNQAHKLVLHNSKFKIRYS